MDRIRRTVAVAAVVMAAVALCLVGCSKKPTPESVPETQTIKGGPVNADKISEHWFGGYDIDITYGDTTHGYSDNPAENAQSIGYGVTIRQDSCTFEVVGFQTYFTYLCKARENGNKLHLLYLKLIDGFQFREPPPLDTIATLIKEGERYYIKSPHIDDTDGAANKKLPLTKRK